MPFDLLLILAAPAVVVLTQAAATNADVINPLLQVGVTGALLIITMAALRAVYQQQIAVLKETVLAERTRADRTEDQLHRLNADVRDRLLVSMTSSADTFREVLRVMEGRR
mgnify:CR=1 FL=1